MKLSFCSLAGLLLLVGCASGPQKTAEVPAMPDLNTVSTMLQEGTLTSETLVNELLNRIDQQAELNAFISINPEVAVIARQRDEQRARGEVMGPLHGIPLVVKDNIHVAGMTNTAGTPGLQNFEPRESNETVVALQAAGAIILGKTNLHELAFGITSSNTAFGAVGNPRDRALFPGGSSGGTAAAIAAGLAPAGLGTDTGGSVRIPAALTGTAGFRPSPGRYPSDRVTPISHTRDTVGVMAGNVADLALLDRAITGQTGSDAAGLDVPEAGTIRLGIISEYYYSGLEAGTASVVTDALGRLRSAGVQLVEVSFPELGEQVGAGFPIALYEAREDLTTYLARFQTGLTLSGLAQQVASPDVKGILGAVAGEQPPVSEADYQGALATIGQMQRQFAALFADQQLDAVIFPTTMLTARPIDGSLETVELNGASVPTFPSYIRNTDPASLAGLPGVSFYAGDASNGLPVGLEIDGAPGTDAALLNVALRLEAILRSSGSE
ncbi:MAG: indoleacetamide hydrolase [Pseudomonadota bacterium]